MDSNKIGVFIKKLREEKEMSQQDLAEKIPIGREAISKWECGRTIPDSQTILRLSEIFNISTDEIMYGEYKTKENKKEVEDINMQIYDDRNAINIKLRKRSKCLLATVILFLITILSFLGYYFFSMYDSVRVYTIESKQDDIYLTDGLLVLTGENIYFKLGNFHGIDENDISKVVLYYYVNGNKKLIYQDSSAKDAIIRDYYGYNEYFETKNKKLLFNELCVDVYYNDEIITINLTLKEEYSNKKLILRRSQKATEGKAEILTFPDNELIKKIKNKFETEDGEIYYYKEKIKNKYYDVYYINETQTLMINWENGKYYYSIEYEIPYKTMFYGKGDSELNNIEQCSYDENNPNDNTCDESIINLLDTVKNRI